MIKDCSTLEVDGRTYELAFEFNAVVDAEQVCGVNLLAAIENMGGGISAAQLRGLLFAMITPWRGFPKEPIDQLKACGNLIRIDTIGPIIEALGEACAIAVSAEHAERYRAAMANSKAPAAAQDAPQAPTPDVSGVPEQGGV